MASHLNTIGMKLRSQAVVVMCRCCTESLQSLQESREAPHIPAPDPVPSHSLTLYNQTMMWGCGRDVEEEHMVCVHKHMPHWWNQTFQGNWVNRCVGICCRLMSLTNCISVRLLCHMLLCRFHFAHVRQTLGNAFEKRGLVEGICQ